jgi:hypothetical protein
LDVNQHANIRAVLNKAKVRFPEKDLLFLDRPEFDQAQLDEISTRGFVFFIASIASARANISGESLLALFNEARPSIMQIHDFSHPPIASQQDMQSIVVRYLKTASVTVLADAKPEIGQHVRGRNNARLRAGRDISFIADKSGKERVFHRSVASQSLMAIAEN